MTATDAETTVSDDPGSGINDDGGAGTTNTVTAQLQALKEMDHAALRAEWRRLHRAHPPQRVASDLLMLGVASISMV
jgi:hypothetical protein